MSKDNQDDGIIEVLFPAQWSTMDDESIDIETGLVPQFGHYQLARNKIGLMGYYGRKAGQATFSHELKRRHKLKTLSPDYTECSGLPPVFVTARFHLKNINEFSHYEEAMGDFESSRLLVTSRMTKDISEAFIDTFADRDVLLRLNPDLDLAFNWGFTGEKASEYFNPVNMLGKLPEFFSKIGHIYDVIILPATISSENLSIAWVLNVSSAVFECDTYPHATINTPVFNIIDNIMDDIDKDVIREKKDAIEIKKMRDKTP